MWLHGSISGIMFCIAIVAFPIGVLASVLNNRPLLGLQYCLDTGLIPSITTLIALMPIALEQRQFQSFIAGFVAAGWMAVVAYACACTIAPGVMASPIIFYINEIEPLFMDSETVVMYSVSLLARGFIMAIPQLLVAVAGGLLTGSFTRRKQYGQAR
jgi:hypothetical protein